MKEEERSVYEEVEDHDDLFFVQNYDTQSDLPHNMKVQVAVSWSLFGLGSSFIIFLYRLAWGLSVKIKNLNPLVTKRYIYAAYI